MKKQSLFASFLALTFLGTSLFVVANFALLRSYLIATADKPVGPPRISLVAPSGEELQILRPDRPDPGMGDDTPIPSERTVRFQSARGDEYRLTMENRRAQQRDRRGYVYKMYVLAGLLTVLLATGLSAAILLWYLRKNSRLALAVMGEMAAGKLEARFPVRRFDEAGQLMTVFNEMAGRIESLVGQIKASEKARLIFFQNLGHDLRTPLGSLRMMTETVHRKGRELDATQIEEISQASLREIEYLGELVNDLVFLALVEDPGSVIKRERVDLAQLIREEVATLSTVASLRSKTIHLEVDERSGPLEQVVPADFCRRLIRNVISNALDFAQTQVSIRLGKESGRVRLVFQDDGPGFPAEVLSKYGEHRMVQLQHGPFSGRSSMGLGAAIVRSIVARLGGELRVANNPGAVVDIRLPL